MTTYNVQLTDEELTAVEYCLGFAFEHDDNGVRSSELEAVKRTAAIVSVMSKIDVHRLSAARADLTVSQITDTFPGALEAYDDQVGISRDRTSFTSDDGYLYAETINGCMYVWSAQDEEWYDA